MYKTIKIVREIVNSYIAQLKLDVNNCTSLAIDVLDALLDELEQLRREHDF